MSISESSPGRTASPLQEARPLHTSEIGSLKKLPDHGTEWLGSSSGVYFVNTVRRAFNAAVSESGSVDEQKFPAAEDILAGRDTPADNQPQHDASPTNNDFEILLYSALGELPERGVASELVMIFFKAWHPLFPFLHGPTFLQDMETLYSTSHEGVRLTSSQAPSRENYDVRKLIVFQLVINIASLDRPDLLPPPARIKSTADVSRVCGVLAATHTIPTIQTLIAAELYLVSAIALRAASTVAGMVLRSIFQTGLHRCPLRYAQLSPEDCELRKRIFWSAYALDRHLSQSLGDPITLQDSDIDVCLSGRELHAAVPVTSSGPMMHSRVITMHLPASSSSSSDTAESHRRPLGAEEEEKRRREAALTAYVQYSRLTGRLIEIFHKSIHARFPKREAIVYLTSDIETWWNDLPDFLSGEAPDPNTSSAAAAAAPPNTNATSSASKTGTLTPFFSILYQQLLLLLNRPALSLDPSSAEFQHGLQVCIKASRTTLSSLKSHSSPLRVPVQTMFLPGLLSANWMAGLIIAFACLLGKYQKARACTDIKTCLELLQSMNSRYNTAKQCYAVLSALLADIEMRKASSTGCLALYRIEKVTGKPSESPEPTASLKRRRTAAGDASGAGGESGSERSPPSESARRSARQRMSVEGNSNVVPSPTSMPASLPQQNSNFKIDSNSNRNMPSNWDSAQPSTAYASFDPAYTYSGFSGVPEYSFSSMPGMPDTMPTVNEIDWAGMNFNMADVFESATWENLIGGTSSALPTPGWETGDPMNGAQLNGG